MSRHFVWVLESWRDIPGYEGLYKVSTGGTVLSLYTNKKLRPIKTSRGYSSVKLYKNGSKSTVAIHRLVAITFKQNPDNKPDVNHINGIKDDNRLVNLDWVTEKENVRHAVETGLIKHKKGTENPSSIFTKKDINNIIDLYNNGMKISVIAKKYNCSLPTIYAKIKLNKEIYD